MCGIVGFKPLIDCLKILCFLSFRHCPVHQIQHAVADKLTYFIQCPLRSSKMLQRCIDTICQILQCI